MRDTTTLEIQRKFVGSNPWRARKENRSRLPTLCGIRIAKRRTDGGTAFGAELSPLSLTAAPPLNFSRETLVFLRTARIKTKGPSFPSLLEVPVRVVSRESPRRDFRKRRNAMVVDERLLESARIYNAVLRTARSRPRRALARISRTMVGEMAAAGVGS